MPYNRKKGLNKTAKERKYIKDWWKCILLVLVVARAAWTHLVAGKCEKLACIPFRGCHLSPLISPPATTHVGEVVSLAFRVFIACMMGSTMPRARNYRVGRSLIPTL